MAHPPSDHSRARRRRFILWRVFLLHRAHRRWRWGMRCIAAVILAIAAALIIVTHSPLTKHLVLPHLESICGMKVEASDVHISHMGYVVINNAVVSIPGVPGE